MSTTRQTPVSAASRRSLPWCDEMPTLAPLRTYADRSLVAAVESVDRPAVVPPDQEVRDGLHGQS